MIKKYRNEAFHTQGVKYLTVSDDVSRSILL